MRDYYSSGSFSNYIVDCPYKDKCTSANSFKCMSCRHNRGKRDYYDPEPFRPFPQPWRPEPFKPVWVSNTTSRSRNMKTPRFVD